jgi:hypothetical protein
LTRRGYQLEAGAKKGLLPPFDAYGGAWFFTTNPEFFSRNQFSPGTNTQSESPVGAFEVHVSYDFKPRLWVSLDSNYWFGGATALNGVSNPGTFQRNSRVGLTASFPLTTHQSLKLNYSDGAYILYSGNYHNASIGWQYFWFGRPNEVPRSEKCQTRNGFPKHSKNVAAGR